MANRIFTKPKTPKKCYILFPINIDKCDWVFHPNYTKGQGVAIIAATNMSWSPNDLLFVRTLVFLINAQALISAQGI